MNHFEQNVIERLTRMETRIIAVERNLKGFKTKVVTIASGLGAFVATIMGYFVKGH